MRIRHLRPEFFTRQTLVQLGETTRLILVGLLLSADDLGRFEADPHILRGALFPYGGAIDVETITQALKVLSKLDPPEVLLYEFGGQDYAQLVGLADPKHWQYQALGRPRTSRLPPPPDAMVRATKDLFAYGDARARALAEVKAATAPAADRPTSKNMQRRLESEGRGVESESEGSGGTEARVINSLTTKRLKSMVHNKTLDPKTRSDANRELANRGERGFTQREQLEILKQLDGKANKVGNGKAGAKR